MLDIHLVFVKKLAHMVGILWAYSEFTSLRKWNSSALPPQRENDYWDMHEEIIKNSEDFYKMSNEQTKQYVHLLNSTLTATERTICCFLENYQKENGVEVPEPLRPFMGGKTFLPF